MKKQRDSFVLRIWREQDQAGWKGWIQHAPSREAVYIQTIEELLAFIEQHTGPLDIHPAESP